MRIWAGTIRGSNEALTIANVSIRQTRTLVNFARKPLVSTLHALFFLLCLLVLVVLLSFSLALDGLSPWGWPAGFYWRAAGAGCGFCGFLGHGCRRRRLRWRGWVCSQSRRAGAGSRWLGAARRVRVAPRVAGSGSAPAGPAAQAAGTGSARLGLRRRRLGLTGRRRSRFAVAAPGARIVPWAAAQPGSPGQARAVRAARRSQAVAALRATRAAERSAWTGVVAAPRARAAAAARQPRGLARTRVVVAATAVVVLQRGPPEAGPRPDAPAPAPTY